MAKNPQINNYMSGPSWAPGSARPAATTPAASKPKRKAPIRIKKANRGKFTAAANAAGKSVPQEATSVLADPNASPVMKKRANFARNAAKWGK